MSTKKIGLQKLAPQNISTITAEEFFKEVSNEDYFFNSRGNCGYIRDLEDRGEQIVFRKNTTMVPNPLISLSKESEFYRLEREKTVLLFCIGAGTGINIFINVKK